MADRKRVMQDLNGSRMLSEEKSKEVLEAGRLRACSSQCRLADLLLSV